MIARTVFIFSNGYSLQYLMINEMLLNLFSNDVSFTSMKRAFSVLSYAVLHAKKHHLSYFCPETNERNDCKEYIYIIMFFNGYSLQYLMLCYFLFAASIQGGGGREWEQTNSSVSDGTIFTVILLQLLNHLEEMKILWTLLWPARVDRLKHIRWSWVPVVLTSGAYSE